MWLSHSRGRAWNCSQCRNNPKLRAQRGSCGGAFQKGLPLAQEDERGLFVPGYRVAPDSGEAFSELEIRSCPVATSNQMASIISAYRRHKAELFPISSTYPNPTCAIVDAMEVIHHHSELAQLRAQERAQKEAGQAYGY